MKFRIAAMAASSMVLASLAGAQSFFDDFNRPDAPTLGVNWTQATAAIGINSNTAVRISGSTSMSTVNGISNTLGTYSITVDGAIAGPGLGASYVGISMAHLSTASGGSIFFKLQDNTSSGNFNTYGFYTGNNVNAPSNYSSGGGFFSFAGTYRTARINLSVAGLVVTANIDGDINNTIDHTFSATMTAGFAAGLGTGAGMGVFGTAMRADNYNLVIPEPGTFVAIGIGLAGLALARRRK